VIFFPQTVTVFLEKEKVVDIDKVNLDMPADAEPPPAPDSNGVNMEDPFGNEKKTPEETPAAPPASGEATKP